MLFKQLSLLLVIFLLSANYVLAANYPLEITQPQAGLDIKIVFTRPILDLNIM